MDAGTANKKQKAGCELIEIFLDRLTELFPKQLFEI